jgi:hypothetical protein
MRNKSFVILTIFVGLLLMAMAPMEESPFSPIVETALFVFIIPWLMQGLKLLRDGKGIVLNKWQNQLLLYILAIIAVAFSGGFVLKLPPFPLWADDMTVYISGLFQFIQDLLGLALAAWATVSSAYELIWDRAFTALKLGTSDKYNS